MVGSEGCKRGQQKASQSWKCHTSPQHRRYLSKDIDLRHSHRIHGFKKHVLGEHFDIIFSIYYHFPVHFLSQRFS